MPLEPIQCPEGLSIDRAKELFSNDYRVIRYNFDDCLGSGGEGMNIPALAPYAIPVGERAIETLAI